MEGTLKPCTCDFDDFEFFLYSNIISLIVKNVWIEDLAHNMLPRGRISCKNVLSITRVARCVGFKPASRIFFAKSFTLVKATKKRKEILCISKTYT